jgi:hypothetical protein
MIIHHTSRMLEECDNDTNYLNVKQYYRNNRNTKILLNKLNNTFDENVLYNIYYQYCKKVKQQQLSMNKEVVDFYKWNQTMEIDCNYIHSIHPFGYNKLSGSSFIKSTTIKINYNSDSDIIEVISTTNEGIKYHMDSLERHIFKSKPNFMNIDNIFIIEYIKRIELRHKESLGKFNYKKIIKR